MTPAPDFSTCDLCDRHKAAYGTTFFVLPPAFADYGGVSTFSGLVSTVKCYEDNSLVKAALDTPGGGRVLVVDGGGSVRRALVGGNVAAAAEKNGWAGLIIDGAVRDVAELAATEVGIRALAHVPIPTEKKNQGERDIAVQVMGIWVRPGDRLFADADGIVVLRTA